MRTTENTHFSLSASLTRSVSITLSTLERGLEVTAGTTLLLTLLRGTCGAGGNGWLLERGGDDFLGDGKVGSQVLDTLVGQVPVVVLPVEGLRDVSLGSERSEEADDLKIGDIQLGGVGVLEIVLLGYKGTLLEKVGVHEDSVLLGNKLLTADVR